MKNTCKGRKIRCGCAVGYNDAFRAMADRPRYDKLGLQVKNSRKGGELPLYFFQSTNALNVTTYAVKRTSY